MMPGLVVKHTNNNVGILECLTSMPEHQSIITNKLEAMEIQETQTQTHSLENNKTKEYPDNTISSIEKTETECNRDVYIEKNDNCVPEKKYCTEKKTKESATINCDEKNESKAEELPDTMDVPKYPDKKPPERNENNSVNIEHNNSISVNIDEQPSTSKIVLTTPTQKLNKLKTFLSKYSVTENDLILRLKNMKRLTKDKIKLDSVLSHKLNRNYLKILKRRRSIKNKITSSKTAATKNEDEDGTDEYSTCESDSDHENPSKTTFESDNTEMDTLEAQLANLTEEINSDNENETFEEHSKKHEPEETKKEDLQELNSVEYRTKQNGLENKKSDTISEIKISHASNSDLDPTEERHLQNLDSKEIDEKSEVVPLENKQSDTIPKIESNTKLQPTKENCEDSEENKETEVIEIFDEPTSNKNIVQLIEDEETQSNTEVNKTLDNTINSEEKEQGEVEINNKDQHLLENTQNEENLESYKIQQNGLALEKTEAEKLSEEMNNKMQGISEIKETKINQEVISSQDVVQEKDEPDKTECNQSIIDLDESIETNNKEITVESEISKNFYQLIIDLTDIEESKMNKKMQGISEIKKTKINQEVISSQEDVQEKAEPDKTECNKILDQSIIDLDESLETNNIEITLESEISKNSDQLIIDLTDIEESKKINEQNPEESDLIEDKSDDDSSQNEERNSLIFDESKTSEDFMTLLETLEKDVEPESQNETENTTNTLEDQNKQSAHVNETNTVLSTIEEEELPEAQTSNKLGETSTSTVIPNLFEDDDIRNKIKQQLELLRRNTRKSTEPIEENETGMEQNEATEMDRTSLESKSMEDISKENDEKKSPEVNVGTDLSDVLISNEGELAIINVVGGYVSDNETEEPEDGESKQEDTTTEPKRGISITDKLLMNLSRENSHIIKPTKTTDITKIKGWKSKTFSVTVEEESKQPTTEITEEIHIDEDVVPPLVYFTNNETSSFLEDPLPGTSSGLGIQPPEIPKPIETPKEEIQLDKQPPENENKKSAFVSDYLETFLSTNSKLKISYEVPKLVAEENISKPEELPLNEYPPQLTPEKNTTTTYKPKQGQTKKAKPKTLAEKRRMLELDRRNELLHDMQTNESIYLKRLEYCEKRNKLEIAEDIRNNLVASSVPFSRLCWKLATKEHRQFAFCNGEKIRLSGSSGGADIVVPTTKLNKFSAKNTVYKTTNNNVRPGPLSKKHKLITKDNWECQVLRMPKIKLEVYPEQNKPLPLIAQQYLQLCRHDQYLVDKNWADFAVTAVRTKEKPERINKHEFEIPYANGRNKILVRRKVRKPSPVKYPERMYSNRFPEINVEENIKDIVSDLLTCVENQELEKKVIKEDPDLTSLFIRKEKYEDRPVSPIDPRVQAIIKRPNARASKTSRELRRLNVQVIEVNVKEDENIPENCMKDYCKLGCVCKSLRGASALIPEHCGREECMLQCICSFETLQKGRHQITLPPGTDILSASTVVRLQDEAKRNLAKVEREFTQTVIKANNQTIMVGGGARERTRRVPKVPKKYSNFTVDKPNLKGASTYDKIMYEEEDIFEMETEKTPPKKKPEIEEAPVFVETKKLVPIWINKPKSNDASTSIKGACRVVLNKMKLDHLIPWCMVHNLYKCHCGGKATFPDNFEPVKIVPATVEDTEYISYNPRFGAARHLDTTPHTVTDITDKYCARTKALPTNYYHARNKSQRFKADYALMKQIEEKNRHFEHYTITNNTAVRNKRKSLDSYETYALEDGAQDLLVPIKKKSAYIKKRDAQSLLLSSLQQKPSDIEEPEIKRPKTFEADDTEDDPLESLSLLQRLNDGNESFPTVKTFQKISLENITKVVRKTRTRKTKAIMRDPDKLLYPNLLPITPAMINKPSSENIQLTSEDFNFATRPNIEPGELRQRRIENTHVVSSTAFIDYDRSYMGLLIPSKEWLDKFHRMLNPNEHTIIHQIRLLEWATMVRRQECNALQIWFNTKKYNNIIFTEDRRRPSPGHVNVKTFKVYSTQNFKIPDIIASLLAGKLPGAAENASETYLILVFNGVCWEARGTIVLSGTTEICRQKLALKPTPVSILTPTLNFWQYDKQKKQKSPKKKIEPAGPGTLVIKTSSMLVEMRPNKDTVSPVPIAQILQPTPVVQILQPAPVVANDLEIISLPVPTPTPIIEASPPVSDKIENECNIPVVERTKHNIGSILAPLPTGGNLHRWFMLILENDFSVLRISFSKFHIKYTHLQTAINMARKSKKTVRIKTPPVRCPDLSENFSIYACPESSQRIFFGPYGNRSDHGLETFRYVNGKLVNTKIYNKMRGSPDRKTCGYWFTHNSTMNYNLNLEPNYDEGSSGSECATASTSIENITKPQIELVDLTENDSDFEEKSSNVDPLLNILNSDYARNDITIEAIPLKPPPQEPPAIPVKPPPQEPPKDQPEEMEIEAISPKPQNKRKSSMSRDEEPVTKQPTLIDSIELDDEEEEDLMPVLEPYNKEYFPRKSPNMQMPPLRPINSLPMEKDRSKNKRLYVITNIPGIGYFEIYFERTKANRQSMYTQIKGSKTTFQTINNAIKYLHYLCTKCIYFMPKSLKVKFSIVDSSDPPEMPKFKDEYLSGYYMISERGIFNILNINTKDLDNLGFDEEEIQKLLSYKCDLLIARNIKQLGTFLFGHEAVKKMHQEEILRMAPSKIKVMEQQEVNLIDEKKGLNVRQQRLLTVINDLQRDIPEHLRNMSQQKLISILGENSPNLKEMATKTYVPDPVSYFPHPPSDPSKSIQEKLDTPAVVKPILCKPTETPKFTLLGSSAMLTKTTSNSPIGKFCRIVDGKLIVLDKKNAAKTAAHGAPRLQIVPPGAAASLIAKPSVNILSPQQFQNLINPNPNDKNSKFELLVPITGLQSPATVVSFGGQNNKTTTITPSPSNLLVANTQPKVVDLTDD